MIATRPKVVGFDLDGTLLQPADHPELGVPVAAWKPEIDALRAVGVKIGIWTCRNSDEYDKIREHLASHGIEVDYINENPHEAPGDSPKVYFDWYVDDRGIRFEGDAKGMAARILKTKPWYKTNPLGEEHGNDG